MSELGRECYELRAVLERLGYRRCDIAACNCGGWHGGHSAQRLTEIGDALVDAGVDLNGKTILDGVKEIIVANAEQGTKIAELWKAIGEHRSRNFVLKQLNANNIYQPQKEGSE